jgi:putative nucleotidyltransferase with HDIG domain
VIRKPVIDFTRSALARLTSWLDRVEERTPRGQGRPWLLKEIHFPPIIIAFVSVCLLFISLFYGHDSSLMYVYLLAIFSIISVALFTYYLKKDHPTLAKSDDAMALLSVIFFSTIVCIKVVSYFDNKTLWISPYVAPVSIAALLTTLLLHQRLGMVIAFVIALLFGVLTDFSLPITLVSTIGGVTMAAIVSRARTAHDIWRSGLITGLAQSFVALFLGVALGWNHHQIGVSTLSSFVSGILASFIALGARPFLESFFSRTSNLRLLELADVNHPLLKKMSIEAPGTFHHSLIVASLAEDAANSIGANGLLCRVGAYFHDIGKMVKAEYFIENQGTFGNPHDQVSPSLSKLVITSHVKEGVALAQANKLEQQITDFIPQHHGTSQIEYFYRKALKIEEGEEEKEEVDVEEYRYPGPKPQSRETAIVMLSDSVEAASRTLEEPNHQRYKDLVYKIVNKKLFDGQLDETTLTLRDLHTIAERFTATLTSIHHARIPYPDAQNPNMKHDVEGLTPPK